MIRIMTFSPYNTPSLALFKKLKIINVYQINDLLINLLMLDLHINNNLTKEFIELFTVNRNVNGHNTRSSNKLHKRYDRTNYGQFSIS